MLTSKIEQARRLIDSRRALVAGARVAPRPPEAAEGGCGVLGFASNVPLPGRHVVGASCQMHNRGNGKGGGIAVAGLDPEQMRVSPDVLRTHYLVQVAYLDEASRGEVERECITGRFDIAEMYRVETLGDYRTVGGLDVRPPEVVRYFARVKPEHLARFAEENGLRHLPARMVEDEYVYQNTFRLNQRYYASLGDKRAFVLSHGRDMLVFKIVGYAEQAAEYYRLEDLRGHVWISHQRYPTKGRIWHPGGAHPFVGVNEALVHNGDFANYHRVTEYLRQRNIVPLFLTDTEVSVLLFDLWDRTYGYPLEALLEALAPTTERDFEMLPEDKRQLYRAIQQTHLQGSPDGPWFFIVARSRPDLGEWQLLGITDTSMLRPQVFALYEHESGDAATPVQIGLIASERQAVNACLRSIAAEDSRFQPLADKYWVARGGSYTDGGAFALTVSRSGESRHLSCHDKFGNPVEPARPRPAATACAPKGARLADSLDAFVERGAASWFAETKAAFGSQSRDGILDALDRIVTIAMRGHAECDFAIAALSHVRDRRFDTGEHKRSWLLAQVDSALYRVFRGLPLLNGRGAGFARMEFATLACLRAPQSGEHTLVVDAREFAPEGDDSAAALIRQAHSLGWRRFVAFDWRGGRFAGCGLGPATDDVRIDIYGDPGDYIGSGLDGAHLTVHCDAQDQAGQILKRGRLVIHGDVGQTFLYGAKGGEIFVLGSAAGRPLINAVGRPRAVINGTCLDYLAESFMAGDPLNGGGFVVLNGVGFDESGGLKELRTPYPGGNLFSLASGGAIYVRDPRQEVGEDQLNGGRIATLSAADWALVEPYLRQNEELFGIGIAELLAVDGVQRRPEEVYRKIEVKSLDVLH
ncbi:MAG: glutamate synthase [Acidobacteriota bacterium]